MKFSHTLAAMSLFSLLFGTVHAAPLQVGDKAPELTAVTDSGQTIDLGQIYRKQPYTLVYFYPKADTPGCTKQGCSLRDANAELAKRGVAIIGVSTDTVDEQKAFKEKYSFPFTLIADTGKQVVKAFGQSGTGRASREAYLIKDGRVVYHDEKITDKQGENVLNFLNAQKS